MRRGACDSNVRLLRHAAQVAGDGQELGALEAWYGRQGGRSPDAPLLIGSVKSNMGHCEGCSGLAGAPAFESGLLHVHAHSPALLRPLFPVAWMNEGLHLFQPPSVAD
jgi:hypothetical protein